MRWRVLDWTVRSFHWCHCGIPQVLEGGCGYEASVFGNEEAKGWPVRVGGIDALLFNVHGIELNVYALIIVEIIEHPSCNVLDVRQVNSL